MKYILFSLLSICALTPAFAHQHSGPRTGIQTTTTAQPEQSNLTVITKEPSEGNTTPEKALPTGLQKMTEAYGQLDQFSADIVVEVYKNDGATIPLFVRKAQVKKDGMDFYSRIGQKATIVNARGVLVIDKEQKNIFYHPTAAASNSKKRKQAEETNFLPDQEKLAATSDSIVFKGTFNGLEHYIFYSSGKEIEVTNLWVDASSHLMKKISYHYNDQLFPENNMVIIRYKNASTKPHLFARDFSEKTYLKSTKEGWQLQAAYADYELIINEAEE